MKKSEITVTMPVTTYEELVGYKEKFFDLSRELAECYDCTLFNFNENEPIRFNHVKAEKVARDFLPYDCRNAEVIF